MGFKTYKRLKAISILATIGLLTLMWSGSSTFSYPAINNNNTSQQKRILIIAPHPDDEVLGTGGVIADAVENGDTVKVVIMTNGESFAKAAKVLTGHSFLTSQDYFLLGRVRHQESRKAAETLGLHPDDVIFLGFADGSLRFLWDDYWDRDRARISGGTNTDHAPYDDIYKPGVAYNGQSVVDALMEIIKAYRPTDIFYATVEDEHPDHWATGAFVEYALRLLNSDARQHAFLVHHNSWPKKHSQDKGAPQMPPSDMKDDDLIWESYALSRHAMSAKAAAIKQYKSQTAVMLGFMNGFVRSSEIFIKPQERPLPMAEGNPIEDLVDQRFLLIKDWPGIERGTAAQPSGDILQLNGFAAGARLYLGLKVQSEISPKIKYNIHLRLFYPDGARRMDLSHQNSWQWQKKAQNSLSDGNIQGGLWDKQWLFLSIPLTAPLPSYIFINADASISDEIIDHLPPRMFNLAGELKPST